MVGCAAAGREKLVILFEGLPYQHFACIHADVPWDFQTWSEAGDDRSAQQHYDCMSIDKAARLPVLRYAAPDCHLFFWTTGPFVATGAHIRIMRSWGFEPTAMAFVWVKINRDGTPRMGLGHTTRQNAEYCLLGRRGAPQRLSKGVHQIIMAPIREHSRKPDEVYDRIESYCDGPRLDLFGRRSRPDWTVVGNEATKFDQREATNVTGGKNSRLRNGIRKRAAQV